MLEEVGNKERSLMRQKSRKALLESREKYKYRYYIKNQQVWKLKQALKTNHLKHSKKTKEVVQKEALKYKERINQHISEKRDLRTELNRLKKKLEHYGSRKSVVYRTRLVKEKIPYEVKKLIKLKESHEGFFNKTFYEKLDLIEVLAKSDIILQRSGLLIQDLVVLMNLELHKETGLSKGQLYNSSDKVISRLVKGEFISKSNYNLFYITPKGVELINETRKSLKSSKSVILNKNIDGIK